MFRGKNCLSLGKNCLILSLGFYFSLGIGVVKNSFGGNEWGYLNYGSLVGEIVGKIG